MAYFSNKYADNCFIVVIQSQEKQKSRFALMEQASLLRHLLECSVLSKKALNKGESAKMLKQSKTKAISGHKQNQEGDFAQEPKQQVVKWPGANLAIAHQLILLPFPHTTLPPQARNQEMEDFPSMSVEQIFYSSVW